MSNTQSSILKKLTIISHVERVLEPSTPDFFPCLLFRPTGNCSIYIGDSKCAHSLPVLNAIGITHIVNVANELLNIFDEEEVVTGLSDVIANKIYPFKGSKYGDNPDAHANNILQQYKLFLSKELKKPFKYHKVPVLDRPYVRIEQHFKDTFAFIDSAVASTENTNVLIHCYAGKSRSFTIALSYTLYFYSCRNQSIAVNLSSIFNNFKSKYPKGCPNCGFAERIVEYYISLFPNDTNWKQNCYSLIELCHQ